MIFVDSRLDLDEDIEFMDDNDNINNSINNTEEFNKEDNLIINDVLNLDANENLDEIIEDSIEEELEDEYDTVPIKNFIHYFCKYSVKMGLSWSHSQKV